MDNTSQTKTRIIAMYLPQYYRTPENDEWWGEGYTDWEAVKKSVPLFDGHKQPRLPMNDYYYDLSEKSTMKWQSALMKKYGIDGICMYHYWFKDGRRVLDKPAENLLKWQDIDMPFCFCWANQTWARTWSNIKGSNPWADSFESKNKSDKGILLDQQYGLEEEWKKHFEYFMPFFRDDRYIRIDNKPVLMIYRPLGIPCLLPMIDYWRKFALNTNFEGIYIIGNLTETPRANHLDAGVTHEPMHAKILFDNERKDRMWRCSYDVLWDKILHYESEEKMFRGAFVNFDDSPRRADKGFVTEGYSVQKFKCNLTKLLEKAYSSGDELVFINAWNEWGEGMYLEPDNWDQFGALEAVRDAKTDTLSKYIAKPDIEKRSQNKLPLKRSKDSYYTNLKAEWTNLDANGIFIGNVLLKYDIKSVGIYGFGELGIRLYMDLLDSSVNVKFFSDRNPQKTVMGIPCYLPEETPDNVDALIVTASFYFDEIYDYMSIGRHFRIISLKQLVEEAE